MKHAMICFLLIISASLAAQRMVTLSKKILKNKIKGGWAGQTIGVTFGGPYEFRFNGTFIQEYQPLFWDKGYVKRTMLEQPGLYDDLYMDLTFVDVFEKSGFDAPVAAFANAFANAGYVLWHANQSARYNILHGIPAPQSGHWMNNPHADDIDYQIESDYAGLMSPGMPNTASTISDKIGHIMNYGDGWYGGVFVGAMYAQAFILTNVPDVVNDALKTIPKESRFYKCIADVIRWHRQYPQDWQQTWFEIQKKWTQDIACTEGVFLPFNIDAKVNAAYVVMALLYGERDFSRTLEIATRAGQDADCNPSTAGGILGTLLGYEKIPVKWKEGLQEAEDIPFKYTTLSLNQVYATSYAHALTMISRNGGRTDGEEVVIATQLPRAVKLEQGFPGMKPVSRIANASPPGQEYTIDFSGTGFVVTGRAFKKNSQAPDTVLLADIYIDGGVTERVSLPTTYLARRNELAWNYKLPPGKHQLKILWVNPMVNYELQVWDYVVYSEDK